LIVVVKIGIDPIVPNEGIVHLVGVSVGSANESVFVSELNGTDEEFVRVFVSNVAGNDGMRTVGAGFGSTSS
jgi:hypothetical protein